MKMERLFTLSGWRIDRLQRRDGETLLEGAVWWRKRWVCFRIC